MRRCIVITMVVAIYYSVKVAIFYNLKKFRYLKNINKLLLKPFPDKKK